MSDNLANHHVIHACCQQFEQINSDCHLMARIIKDNIKLFAQCPAEVIKSAFHYMAQPMEHKPSLFKHSLVRAFSLVPSPMGMHMAAKIHSLREQQLLEDAHALMSQFYDEKFCHIT